MARLLHGKALWKEIRQLAQRSQCLIAAVGFVGKRPDRLLQWPRRSVLIADLSEARVREGSSSAKGALRLLKQGVKVLSLPGLHAKVFLFDRHAVVGSMNLSEDSQERLEEAGVVLSGKELRGVRQYLRRLQHAAIPMSEDILRERAKREPRRPRFAAPRARADRRERGEVPAGRVWLLPTKWDREKETERRAAKRALTRLRKEHGVERITWYNACGVDLYRRAREGDWVYCWWAGRRSWGRLEGPYQVVQPVDLGARFEDRRYRLALYRPRRMGWKMDIPLDEGDVRLLAKLVGDPRKPEEVRSDPLKWKVRLLSEAERRKLKRVLARLEEKNRRAR
ncbi:MAG TPA: phospholipase D family protein [Thermoflexus sp.]|nr:phospholipase D family protein [Thermoflexus sp.]